MLKTDDAIANCTRRAQAGSLKAFEELVRHYEGSIRAWAVCHCPPGVDADDVAQSTFVAAFEKLQEFQAGTDLGGWLFTIARYQMLAEISRARRRADYRARYALECLDGELVRRAKHVEDGFADRLAYLSNCLEALSERSRDLVNWRYSEGISLAEMANRAGRSVAAIKKQLWVIRKKLRECVEVKLSAGAGGVR